MKRIIRNHPPGKTRVLPAGELGHVRGGRSVDANGIVLDAHADNPECEGRSCGRP